MDWSKLAGSLAGIGLTGLGTAFGGPLGGTVGGALGAAIASALGVEATPEAIQAKIVQDPETVKAQLADMESARRADIDTLRVESESAASARQMQIVAIEHSSAQEWMPSILAAVNTAGFFLTFAGLLILPRVMGGEIPQSVRDILLMMFGALIAMVKDSQGFFFGTTRSSERNGAAMRSIAQSANVPTPAQQVGAALGAAVKQAVKK